MVARGAAVMVENLLTVAPDDRIFRHQPEPAMSNLRDSDFSRIRDEDLTAEQRREIERRFHAFAHALTRGKTASKPAAAVAKNVSKWTPKKASR